MPPRILYRSAEKHNLEVAAAILNRFDKSNTTYAVKDVHYRRHDSDWTTIVAYKDITIDIPGKNRSIPYTRSYLFVTPAEWNSIITATTLSDLIHAIEPILTRLKYKF